MPNDMSDEECRLKARAEKMEKNAKYLRHLCELVGEHFPRLVSNGEAGRGGPLNAAFMGAVDAMLYDDQSDNGKHPPHYWGTYEGRRRFFENHWGQLRLE